MNEQNTQLAVTNGNLAISNLAEMDSVAQKLSASGLMGPKTTPEMVYGLMLLCHCEGLNPIAAMKRYHIVEGRPSMRADAMQAEFLARGGAIIFHVRTDEMVAATLFADKSKLDDAARKRANERFNAMWELDCEADDQKRGGLMVKASQFSMEGEETIIRTFADCQAKGLTQGRDGIKANWRSSPRQMLTARVITEGVRLVNPGLIAGIYNEDETADIVRQEQEARAAMIDHPTDRDAEAIMEIIAGYDSELKADLPDSRRKTLLGLRSDLVCKLGDLGLKMTTPPEAPEPTVAGVPAKAVEAVVLPPEPKTEPKPEKPARKQTPKAGEGAQPDADDNIPLSFRDVECHVGPNPGRCFGRKLGDIFNLGDLTKQPNNEKQVDALLKWFADQALATSPDSKDKSLWKAAQESAQARKAELAGKAPQKAPEPPKATETAPEPEKQAQEPVAPKEWQDYVVPGKHPDYSGKRLGDLSPEIIRRISVEYLPLIDWTKATLPQKSLKAKIALAMADLNAQGGNGELSLGAEEPAHTAELKKRIADTGLNRNSFFTVCHKNGYIADDAHKIEDINETDAAVLFEGWETVAKETLAEQP